MTLILNEKTAPAVMETLQAIYQDGNAIRAMLLLAELADLGIKHGLIGEEDRTDLVMIHKLLGELSILKQQELIGKI